MIRLPRLCRVSLFVSIALLVVINAAATAAEPDAGGATADKPAGDRAADKADALQRPAYHFLRQDEDWSVLAGRDTSTTGDLFDPIKYMPLIADGSVWASFGGHIRLRVEGWSNFNFGAPPAADHDDVFLLTRIMLHGDVHIGQYVRVFVEGKSALSTDRDLPGGKRTLDVDTIDLQQLFADLTLPLGDHAKVTVRPGRQMFQFGKQRLVSPLPWGNTLRTWDGVSVIANVCDWKVHGFWSQFAPVRKYAFNEPDGGTEFYGVYATGKLPWAAIGLDAYWLGLKRDGAVFNGTTGKEQRQTLGGRLWGTIGETGLDYDVEGAYQLGEIGAADIDAFMVATQFGYKLAQFVGAPRVWVGFDYASGDKSPGGNVQTFNQLFPLGHAYLGFIDQVGRQNVIDVSTGVGAKPIDKVTAGVAAHFFWLADNSDALYNAGGGVVRAGGTSNDQFVGVELDLTVKCQLDRHTSLLFGYSHFFPGDVIDDSGPSRDIDFGYVMLQFTF